MMQGQISSPKAALDFMLAGKATVTLRSLASGNRYTYKIVAAEKRNPNDAPTWFVKLLNGQDNENSYVYIGIIRGSQFVWTAKSRVSKDAPSFIGFNYVFNALVDDKMNGFEVWHEGKCGRCGRKLTVPESVTSGFGPECISKVGVAAAAVAAPVVTGTVAPQRNLNFDGSVRQKPVAVHGRPIEPAKTETVEAMKKAVYGNVGDIDAEIRRRINEFKSEAPENYYQDGELDEKQAFNIAYNMFRVKIQGGN